MRTTTTSRVKMLFVPLQLSLRKAKSLHYLLLSLSLFIARVIFQEEILKNYSQASCTLQER